ncbi:MAG: DMT family transporter [Candidatus Saccharimonas aalborgensis]
MTKPDNLVTVQMNKVRSGILALIVLTAIYGITAVMARFFSDSIGLFEQWYIRFSIALVLMLVVFHRKIRFAYLFQVSRRERILVAVRGLLGFVAAAGLYALSTQYASIASVAVMQAIPTMALFGWLILRETMTTRKFSLILLAFVGALLVASRSGVSLSFGYGELLSLASGALFSLTFVFRKLQTGELNNHELAFATTAYGVMGNYIMAVLTTHHIVPSTPISPLLWLLFLGAGALSVGMSLLSHYGFEHVKATTASIILDMELVFGLIFGYLFYREWLTPQQFVGAIIILVATIAMTYLESRKTVVAPSPE